MTINCNEVRSRIQMMREEVVHLVGICGRGTHPLTEILEDLDARKLSPEEALRLARQVPSGVVEFR